MENSAYEQREPEPDAQADLSAFACDRDVEVVVSRVLACLFDVFLTALLSSVALAPLLFVRLQVVLVLVLMLLYLLLFCVFYLVYVAVFEGFWGRTLGKALMRIEVVREEDGRVPGPWRAALRALLFLFVDMFLGIFVMLASPKRQRPGDLAASTLVVRKRGA
ncbi:MAG: hypothetical protein QOI57_23 [Rubrobacteraceae bacterium]|nr:hypothetical protein [Rubrobacteraceae bacterium]